MTEPTRRDPWVRAAALTAAATWQPWTPGQPERDAIADLLETASVFAAWIESGEQQ